MADKTEETPKANYGCADYRDERRLLGLSKKLENPNLIEKDRAILIEEIAKLEKKMGMG
jgi:hypothetical protein